MAKCKTYKQTTHIVYAHCEKCSSELVYNGEIFDGKIKRYGYTCSGCGEKSLLVEKFPYQYITMEEEVNENM